MTPFEQARSWPVGRHAVAVISDAATAIDGDSGVFELASVSKLFVALTAMVALEEGTIDLDDPAGPEGSTVRHLLAHASGLAFDSDRVIGPVGGRRVYSNTGIEVFASHLAERAGMPFDEYLRLGVLEPLGMRETVLYGSPAFAMRATIRDVAALARELRTPTLVDPATLDMARRPVFPDLAGVLPGIGRFDPNPFGLAIEVKDSKSPHWSGHDTSAQTYGHFGGAGTFVWVDPLAGVAAVGLTDRGFDAWAMRAWPEFGDLVIARVTGGVSG